MLSPRRVFRVQGLIGATVIIGLEIIANHSFRAPSSRFSII